MNEINKKEGLIKRDEQFEQLKKHLLITNQNLKKKNIPEKEKIQIIVSKTTHIIIRLYLTILLFENIIKLNKKYVSII